MTLHRFETYHSDIYDFAQGGHRVLVGVRETDSVASLASVAVSASDAPSVEAALLRATEEAAAVGFTAGFSTPHA